MGRGGALQLFNLTVETLQFYRREVTSTDHFVHLYVRIYVYAWMSDMTISSLSAYLSLEHLLALWTVVKISLQKINS